MGYEYARVLSDTAKGMLLKAVKGESNKVKSLKEQINIFLNADEEYEKLKEVAEEINNIIEDMSDSEIKEIIKVIEDEK